MSPQESDPLLGFGLHVAPKPSRAVQQLQAAGALDKGARAESMKMEAGPHHPSIPPRIVL